MAQNHFDFLECELNEPKVSSSKIHMKMSQIVKLTLVILGTVGFLWFLLPKNLYLPFRLSHSQSSKVIRKQEALKNCVLDLKMPTLFKELDKITNGCARQFAKIRKEDFLCHQAAGDRKCFLKIKNKQHKKEECIWVTMGIGSETAAEKAFKASYPDCHFFGIEANSLVKADFDSFGTVIPLPVSGKTGKVELSVLRNGLYWKEDVMAYSLAQLAKKFIKSNLVYFATLDVEGMEFAVLDQFRLGMDSANLTVCQIYAEFHKLAWQPPDFRFELFLRRFLEESPYVPVYGTAWWIFRKITFVNVKSPICEGVFHFSKYFVD